MLNFKNIGCFLQRTFRVHRWGQTQIIYAFAKEIDTKTTKKIVLSKKKNKQLALLKKSLGQKQPLKSPDLYEQYHYRQIYKRINTQLQSFFYSRSYNIQNFNFLINLISEQMPQDYKQRIEQVLQKMALMKIQPNEKTYNYMIKTAANKADLVLAQKYFNEAVEKFLSNKFFYTSLMQAYVNANDTRMAIKILDEMVEKGLEPDLPTYTTLINCLRRGRNLQKCWQLHKKMVTNKTQQDETYTGVMLKVFAATHDAEKAIKLYKENITDKGIKPMVETINSYFKALATRRQYANHVVDRFIQLSEQGNILTTETANWTLKACSTIANVRSAGEILKIMKIREIKVEASTLSILLKVYATACLIPNQDQKLRDIIIVDSWKILEQIDKMGGVNTLVLNNMLSIYANSINYQQIDGLVLPLFDKYKQPYNMYTYEILIDLYYRLDNFTTMMRIWKQMKKNIQENQLKYIQKYDELAEHELKINKLNEDIRPTFKTLHCYLDVGIKMMDMNQVTQALKMFKKYNRTPKNATLKFLGNLQNLPQQIQTALMQFKIQFGKAKLSKKQLPNIKDPQDL